MPKKTYTPLTVYCKDCGQEFSITPEEQKYFKSMCYELPKRCPECRRKRKEVRKEAERLEKERILRQEQVEKQKKWEGDEKALSVLFLKLPYGKTTIEELSFDDPDHSLVIIGNGFDIMHGVKSSYIDFSKTIGKNCSLRFEMETYLDTGDLWFNLEEALGKLNYSMFLNQTVLDMWLEDFDAYNPDAQAADFFAAVETAIAPTFTIPRELNQRFRKWVKTLSIESTNRPFSVLHGEYKVLCFNYTEFIEDLYGANPDNICYIHGCRKNRGKGKPDELILGHKAGTEEEQWEKVDLKPIRFKNSYKRYVFEAAMETAVREAAWYDESTIKKCDEIIKNHMSFFDGLSDTKAIYVIGHSLAEVDYPYFEEVKKHCKAARWIIGYHSYDDMMRLCEMVKYLHIDDVTVFRT